MDGYAVDASATVSARETQALALRLGEDAFPVNTGDPLPDNTNAVIMIEHVNQADEQTLLIYASAPPWQHVRLMGEDMVATETVLQVNHQLRPVDLGALAGCGHHSALVRRLPRVHHHPDRQRARAFRADAGTRAIDRIQQSDSCWTDSRSRRRGASHGYRRR